MKKTRKFKTRLIAGILSAITVFSVGTMAISSASAFAIPGIAETVLSTTFGYAKDEVMKLAGPELSKMGLPPILNMVLGLEDDGPSNQGILDKIDKSTEEIKADPTSCVISQITGRAGVKSVWIRILIFYVLSKVLDK